MYCKSVINIQKNHYYYQGNVTQETMIVTVSKKNKSYKLDPHMK